MILLCRQAPRCSATATHSPEDSNPDEPGWSRLCCVTSEEHREKAPAKGGRTPIDGLTIRSLALRGDRKNSWSGGPGSNRHHELGRLRPYHWTTPAAPRAGIAPACRALQARAWTTIATSAEKWLQARVLPPALPAYETERFLELPASAGRRPRCCPEPFPLIWQVSAAYKAAPRCWRRRPKWSGQRKSNPRSETGRLVSSH